MSIQGMRRRFAVHLRYVLYVIIGVFIVGLPFVFTPGLTRRSEEEGSTESKDVIARVNGQPMQRARLDQAFDQAMAQVALYQAIGQSVGLEQLARFRLQAFEQAMLNELLLKQAAAEGVKVSRGDVKRQAEKIADQQLEQLRAQYKGDQLEPALGRIVAITEKKEQARSMSPGSFRKWMVKRLLDQSGDQLRDELTIQKLREKATGGVTGSEQDMLASYDRMNTRELLVSLHPEGKPARTEEEARKRAEGLAAKAKQGADFAALAKAESDGKRGRESGGQQPIILFSAMSPDMQKALASLKPGDVSPPVKTAAGYVVVKVEGRTRELPKDFEKNRQQLLAGFAQRRQSQAWQDYTQKLRQSARVEVVDPELLAYQAIEQNKPKDALAEMQKAAGQANRLRGLVAAIIYYNLAEMYAVNSQWKEAADSFSNAADAVTQDQKQALPDARSQALMGLAEADEKLGNQSEALNWYQEASNWADTPPIHSQLIAVYQRLGKPDLVKKEQEWLAQYQQAQMEKEKAMLEQQKAASAPQQKPGAATPVAPTPAPSKPTGQAPAGPKPAQQKPAAPPPPPQPAERGR